jgi:hypothetical protein
LYRLVQAHFTEVHDDWEERFDGCYWFWRSFTDKAIGAFLDCGILENGFTRVRCGACGAEYLVAFSCKGRGLCPSCAAKRAAAPGGETLLPGMIAVVQTFGDDLTWHPHVHALVTRGGWDASGEWVAVPFVDGEAAALVFRHRVRVFTLLRGEGLLSEERIRLLLSWRHSGFSVHTSVTVPPDDRDGLERLARYLLRPPVSLERLHVDEHAHVIAYAARCKPGLQVPTATAPPDPKDFCLAAAPCRARLRRLIHCPHLPPNPPRPPHPSLRPRQSPLTPP